ncbi:type II toxin-antitoxin system death-on-curing family toxin [Thermomonas brevis]
MFVWVERHLALAVHEEQLNQHGGAPGVRDMSLLDSALARPRQLAAYGNPPPDFAALAAALAHGIARNHPLVDGNKRTAHVCYRVFLALNGMELRASPEAKYLHMLGLAEGSVSEAEFADWLRDNLRPASRVQER